MSRIDARSPVRFQNTRADPTLAPQRQNPGILVVLERYAHGAAIAPTTGQPFSSAERMRPLLKLVDPPPGVVTPPIDVPAAAMGADRRVYERIAVTDLPWVKGVRLKYGAPLSLIDLSIGGAQVESAVTLRPGSTIVVQIQGEDKDIALASQVLRCHIAAIAPVATYRGALAFKRAVELPGLGAYKANAALDAAHEFARLTLAIRRLTAHRPHDAEEASPIRYGIVMT